MSQSDILYSINNIQFRAVYDDQTKAFTPYTKIDGGTFTLNVSDIQIGAIEIKDGTTDDRAHVSPGGLLSVDASGAVVPISATALPLPSGAATSANQASIISAIGNTNTALGLQAKLSDTQPVSIAGPVSVTGTFFQGSQPVSLASLPNGNVTILNASLPVTGTFWQGTQPVSLASTTITGSVAVTGTFWQATQPISAAALPLPTGAATDATLTGRGAFSRLTDGTNDAAVKASNVLPQPTDTAVVVTVRDREPSAPSYTLQLALIEEMRALRRSLALNSNAFVPIPDGPAFWAQ